MQIYVFIIISHGGDLSVKKNEKNREKKKKHEKQTVVSRISRLSAPFSFSKHFLVCWLTLLSISQ